jgi:hypothetical protein
MLTTIIILSIVSIFLLSSLLQSRRETYELIEENIKLLNENTNMRLIRHKERIKHLDDLIKVETEKNYLLDRLIFQDDILIAFQDLNKRLN